MRNHSNRIYTILLLALFTIAGVTLTFVGDKGMTIAQAAPAADNMAQTQTADPAPPEIGSNSSDWPLAHQNYHNHRTAIDSSITSGNVDELGVAWEFKIPGQAAFGSAASAPLIVDDTVYFQDLASNVFALDLATGEQQWEKRYDAPVTGPNGPGVGYGKVFVASGVNSFAAINMENGEEVWSVETAEERPTGAIQPYIYDNKLYITTQAGVAGTEGSGVRGYEAGRSGHIYALDPESGETIWQFQTVQDDFWGHPEVNSGAGIWYSPVIDQERGLTIWGTGNPAPFPGTVEFPNAGSREEPNLYANSVIALDHETGELVWYNYVNPNDLFDLDVQISPMLITTTVDGETRDLVIGSGKVGDILAIDPETGETVWRTQVGRHQNDELTAIPEEMAVTVYPGALGGVETPMAFADGTIYAPVLNLPTEYNATGFGAETGTEALTAANEHTEIGSGTSELVAVDAATGIVLWSHEFATENYGGATVVNDLLFTATADGIIHALSRETGEEIWSWQAPAGINAWPAVAGDTIIWPAGNGSEPVLVALRLGAGGDMAAETEGTSTDQPSQASVQDSEIYKQSPWWPYLSTHMEDEDPPAVAGGPIQLSVLQESGGANWIFPSPRELDPVVFGTEENPKGTEVPPILLGVPLEMREVMTDGTFITSGPTPFGNQFASTRGTLDLRVTDATATDAAVTNDEIAMTATFRAPMNQGEYRVEVTDVASHGWFIPTAGGVATNYIQHGVTGWGTRLLPSTFVYVGFWGRGDVYLDDELMDEDRLIHGMLTEFVREAPYDMVFEGGVQPGAWHFHLIMPAFTPQGAQSPVNTGFELPNGMMQPFFHVMFPNIELVREDAMDREEAVPDDSGESTVTTDDSGAGDSSGDMTARSSEEATDTSTGRVGDAADTQEVDRTIEVTAEAMQFTPGTEEAIQIQAGETVRFVVESVDIFHTFTVAESEDAAENLFSLELFPTEGPSEIVWTFDAPGEYYLYCKPHEGLGMVGTIEVTE